MTSIVCSPKGENVRRGRYACGVALIAVAASFCGEGEARGASSGNVDVQALADLVKAQARQIHDLQARLDLVEKRSAPATAKSSSALAGKPKTAYAATTMVAPAVLHPVVAPPQASSSVVATANQPVVNEARPTFRIANDSSNMFTTRHVYPLIAAPPGTYGAISAMPSNSSPVYGVESSIPSAARTTTVGGLVLNWGKGLPEFTTPDGHYAFRVRGRVLADYGAAFGSRFGGQNVSRTGLRAARIGIEGRARQLSWVFETDFSGNQVQIVSAFATWSDKMAGHLVEYTLGNKFNERGFDGSTGSDQTVFLDRDLVANAILPVKGWYGLGGAYKIFGKSWHVAAQITGDDVNSSNTTNNVRDDLTYELRSHWIPWRSKDALIHLGAWGFYEDVKPAASFSQNVRLMARTDDAFSAYLGPTVPLANSLAGGLELFGIWKNAWALAEGGVRSMKFRDLSGGGRGTEKAASAQTGIFLTGETPNYFAHTGQWATPRVLNPVPDGGLGAWEVAARADWLDASDVPTGARAWTVTLGVNWYLVNYARLMLNYTHAHVSNKTGSYIGETGGNMIGMRAGVTF
ncbi:hypothetical protein J2D73_04865 [Acetobacter sacchari]|uniref:Porin n=1 Tax=Acetobacter sacchari TaxID=2661687 RepID=A0ABS3LT89_9PROT|nr:porin [Acetobacter sacchari]MBO1359128.1 hypothetical protein [Acetobacter sacchari]